MKIAKVRDVKTPERGTPQSAGLDFFVPNGLTTIYLGPGQSTNIPSGITANIPTGHALIAMNKSGISLNKGLQVGACVIDEDYQGEIHLHVINISSEPQEISAGMKLVQFLCIPISYVTVEEVLPDELFFETSVRGVGGFGSTNKEEGYGHCKVCGIATFGYYCFNHKK